VVRFSEFVCVSIESSPATCTNRSRIREEADDLTLSITCNKAAAASFPLFEVLSKKAGMELHTVVAGCLPEVFSLWSVASPTALAAASIAVGPRAVCPIIASVMSRSQNVAPAAFNKVAASLFRRAHAAGRFGPFPLPKLCIIGLGDVPDGFVESCLRCIKDASAAAASPNPLSEFVGRYVAFGPTSSLTCDAIKRRGDTLRRLIVPVFATGAVELACAVAECRVIEALNLTQTNVPFRSWAHLGSTLHTLSVHVPAVTFRMLADSMPALRVLRVSMSQPVAHDGFIDVVSRLRSLEVHASPWASLRVTDWPAAFPNLEALVWWFGNTEDNVLPAEILRRAPSLRSASVPHVSALSAVRDINSPRCGTVDVSPAPPLLHVRALTLTEVAEDGAALAQIFAAAPAVTSLTLRCASDDTLWRALDGALAIAERALAEGMSSRVRRLRLDTDRRDYDAESRRQLADRVVRLFPRVRVASCGIITDHLIGRARDDESTTINIFPLD
jgi:hypothetical protein